MTPAERVAKSKAKRKAKRYIFELHADDDNEHTLIKKLEQIRAEKRLKSVIMQSLQEFFKKNKKNA